MKLFTKISMLLAVVSSTMALDIPSYYNLDIKVIEISIEGGKERLAFFHRFYTALLSDTLALNMPNVLCHPL